MTASKVREALATADCHVDSISLKNDVYTIRRGYYLRNGFDAEMLADKVRRAFPSVIILETGEVWKAFLGGASVAQQSHWFVKFRLLPAKV
jgi:hypothetical protein